MALRFAIAILTCGQLALASGNELPAVTSCADVHATAAKMLERARTMTAKELDERLERDPGDLEARALLLARIAPRSPNSRRARESVEWLVSSCPAMPLLAHPSVARVATPDLDALWAHKVRHSSTAAVLGNYWSYRAARQPLDLRPRPTDPSWSAAERSRHIEAYRSSKPGTEKHHARAYKAFEALRLELRSGGNDMETLLAAAKAAFDAGFQDAAERYAGEYLSSWNRGGRRAAAGASFALGLMAEIAKSRGDASLAKSARLAAKRLR